MAAFHQYIITSWPIQSADVKYHAAIHDTKHTLRLLAESRTATINISTSCQYLADVAHPYCPPYRETLSRTTTYIRMIHNLETYEIFR
jgi:hypothetical protein